MFIKTIEKIAILALQRYFPLRTLISLSSLQKEEFLSLFKDFNRCYHNLESHIEQCYLERKVKREIILFGYLNRDKSYSIFDLQKYISFDIYTLKLIVNRICFEYRELSYLFDKIAEFNVEAPTINGDYIEDIAFKNDMSPLSIEKIVGEKFSYENTSIKNNSPFFVSNHINNSDNNVSLTPKYSWEEYFKKLFIEEELKKFRQKLKSSEIIRRKSFVLSKSGSFVGSIIDVNRWAVVLNKSGKVLELDIKDFILYKNI